MVLPEPDVQISRIRLSDKTSRPLAGFGEKGLGIECWSSFFGHNRASGLRRQFVDLGAWLAAGAAELTLRRPLTLRLFYDFLQ
jgi:hypothetical protein